MRIKLIYPRMNKTCRGTAVKSRLAPPQGLLALAAVTPERHAVSIVDENVMPLDTSDRPDLVGITVYVATAPRAYAIADEYRKRGVPVVLGGLHVSALPSEARRHADAVVVGEADRLWPVLLADLEQGRLQARYEAEPPPLDGLPRMPREMIGPLTYLTRNSLLAARGCNRRCAFCYRSSLPRSGFRTRPVQEVAEEAANLEGHAVVLLDDNLAADRKYARRLFAALRGLDKVWMGAASIDVADDEHLLDLMAESGCCSLFVGIESLNQRNLDAVRKGSNRTALYEEHVRRIRARGIMINGSFVFGFDGDGPSVFDETVAWAIENNLDTATFHILTPYPGTPLFKRLAEEGRILDRDWAHYDTAHVVFRPAGMSVDQLQVGYERAYDRFYSWGAILQRASADAWGRLPRLMLNVGYKRMNRLWPILGLTGMARVPFEAFLLALRAHRRSHEWERAPKEIAPSVRKVPPTPVKEPALVR